MTGTGLRGYTATTTMHASEHSTLVPATTLAQRNTTADASSRTPAAMSTSQGPSDCCYSCSCLQTPASFLNTGDDMAGKDSGLHV